MNNWDIIIYWDIYIKHLKIYISLSTNELNGATSESYIESPLQSMHRKQTAPFSWTGGICEAHKTQAVASPGKNATLHSTLDCFFCPGEVGHFFFNNLQVFQLAKLWTIILPSATQGDPLFWWQKQHPEHSFIKTCMALKASSGRASQVGLARGRHVHVHRSSHYFGFLQASWGEAHYMSLGYEWETRIWTRGSVFD